MSPSSSSASLDSIPPSTHENDSPGTSGDKEDSVDHRNSGHTPSSSRNSSRSSRSGHDHNNDEDKSPQSSRSSRSREERHSHHSSRHRHDEKEPVKETSSSRKIADDDIRDEDKSLRSSKSHRSNEERHSHHFSRHLHDEKEPLKETSSSRKIADDDMRDEDKSLRSSKSHRSNEERRSHHSSHHSSRHRHDEKECLSETSSSRNIVDDDIRDEDRSLRSSKSHRSREERRSHHSSRHHHDEKEKETHGETESLPNTTNDTIRDEAKSLKSSKSTNSREKRRSHHSSRHHHDEKEEETPTETSSLRNLTTDDIRRITQSHMRRSECGPDLLKEFAQNGVPEDYQMEGLQKFRVVSGAEARSIYNDVLQADEERTQDPKSHGTSEKRSYSRTKHHRHPVVFAFPVHVPTPGTLRAGGRKVVDYYMTWKGKTGTHRLKGTSRKNDFLEPEFLKIAQGFDQHQKKRLSKLITTDLTEEKPVSSDSTSPPTLTVSQAEESKERQESPLRRPPVLAALRDSNLSVLSLPTLGVPLKITNPDPSSPSATERSSAFDDLTTHQKKSRRKHHDSSEKGLASPKLEPVSETEEEEDRSKSRRHKHRRSRRDKGSSLESLSSASTSSKSSSSSNKSEILIVLMDSDHEQDLDANDEALKSTRLPSKRSSSRKSPWDGPVATSNGDIHQYIPSVLDALPENSNHSRHSNEEVPFVPLKTALHALGLHPHNHGHSPPIHSHPSPNRSHSSPGQPHAPPLSAAHSQQAPSTPYPSVPSPISYTRSSTLPTPISATNTLPYHLGAISPYGTPFALSTPNLHSSPPPGVALSGTSYVMPWASSSTPVLPPPGSLPLPELPSSVHNNSSHTTPTIQYSAAGTPFIPPTALSAASSYAWASSTPVLPLPGSLPLPELPSSVYNNSSHATPAILYSAAGTPFIPPSALSAASPHVGASGASGRTVVPLPNISFYAGTAASRSESQLVSY